MGYFFQMLHVVPNILALKETTYLLTGPLMIQLNSDES